MLLMVVIAAMQGGSEVDLIAFCEACVVRLPARYRSHQGNCHFAILLGFVHVYARSIRFQGLRQASLQIHIFCVRFKKKSLNRFLTLLPCGFNI